MPFPSATYTEKQNDFLFKENRCKMLEKEVTVNIQMIYTFFIEVFFS